MYMMKNRMAIKLLNRFMGRSRILYVKEKKLKLVHDFIAVKKNI